MNSATSSQSLSLGSILLLCISMPEVSANKTLGQTIILNDVSNNSSANDSINKCLDVGDQKYRITIAMSLFPLKNWLSHISP